MTMKLPAEIMQAAEKVAENFMELDYDEPSWLAGLIVLKNSHGKTGMVEIKFDTETRKFVN